MNIMIKGKDMDLTQANQEYAEMKIGSLSKFFDNIIEARIELGLNVGGQNKGKIFVCNVNLQVPNKVLRVEEREKTLNKAIDKAKDDLQAELKEYKRKLRSSQHGESIKEMEVDLPTEDE